MIFIRRDPPRDASKSRINLNVPLIIKLDARRSQTRLLGDARYAAESRGWPGYVMYKGSLEESTWVKIRAETRHESGGKTEWRQVV